MHLRTRSHRAGAGLRCPLEAGLAELPAALASTVVVAIVGAVLALGFVALGLGVGLAMTLSADAILAAAPPKKAGAVAAISETAYEIGIVLGIAVLGSILTAVYRGALALPSTIGGAARARVEDSLGSATAVSESGSPVERAALDAFNTAMQTTSFIAASLLLVAPVIVWRLIPSDGPAKLVAERGPLGASSR